jgi:hypothetical protein
MQQSVDAHRALLREGQSIFAFFGLDEEHFSQKKIQNYANVNRPSDFVRLFVADITINFHLVLP